MTTLACGDSARPTGPAPAGGPASRSWPATWAVLPAAALPFATVAFRIVPLVCLAAAAAAGAIAGPGWSERLAPWPWLVSLALVGLPHGAADFAVSRRSLRGWRLVALWLGYATAIAAVAAGFRVAPVPVLAMFAVLSCWHFGVAHVATDGPSGDGRLRVVAAVARGAIVLAVPLAAWPVETTAAAADLISLAGSRSAPTMVRLSPAIVQAVGLALGVVAAAAVAVEARLTVGRPGGRCRLSLLLVELAVIGGLGLCTHPLFSVGLYFLVWHGWRQMEQLSPALAAGAPRSWAELGGAVARIHAAALPLLVPAWAAVGTAWWFWSPAHDPRDLALLSIGGYLLVTPAHELLGDLLAMGPRSRADAGPHGDCRGV